MRSQRTSRRAMRASLRELPLESNAMTQAAMSEEQRLFFTTQGYLVVPDALSPQELAAIRSEADAAEARWRADLSLPGGRRSDLEQLLGILEHGPALFDLLQHPRIFPLVRALLGPDVMM